MLLALVHPLRQPRAPRIAMTFLIAAGLPLLLVGGALALLPFSAPPGGSSNW